MQSEEEFEFDDQRKDEEIILVKHQHPWVLAKLGLVIVLLTALVFLSFLIWGASLYSVVVLIGVVIIITIYTTSRMFVFKNSIFILTNYRVINIGQNSLFQRKVQETELENIYNLQYEIKGMMRSLLNFGNIELTTQGDESNIIKFYNIENPHFIHEKISDARRQALDRVGKNS